MVGTHQAIKMSVFTALPQDMLQHEINRFLDPVSRANFNAVLKPDERVYKKMPKDYALKHALITKRLHYETIATHLNILLDELEWALPRPSLRAAIELKKTFAFLKDPVNAFIYMYLRNLKGKMMRMVELWMEDDQELYGWLPDRGRELRVLAKETRDYIAGIQFVRHVSTVDHQSMFV